MPHTVLISRALPLPEIQVDGETVHFVEISNSSIPDDARVLCSTALDQVDAKLINRLPTSVGLIANLGVGTDNIDLATAKARNILVSNTPVVTEDTADLAFSLLLSAARRIGQNERFARAGLWSESKPMGSIGNRVHGKTLGIIGFGNIGQAVARRASGFGMKILYWNRSPKPDAETELGVERIEDIRQLLRASDFISLHTPLTKKTRHLINESTLNDTKHGAVLVNTGRGALVDESALVNALESGQIGACGLDVFEFEPDIHPGLLELEQVVLTPHIGSATSECRIDIVKRGLSNITSFLQSGEVTDFVSS
ncbi:MAG: 2-hydroxyacid dehydrogenase [Maricaulaceae bacterium]